MSTQPPDPTSSAAYSPQPATSPYASVAQPVVAQPKPAEEKKARQFTSPHRELVALVLLGVNGVFLLAGLITLLTSLASDFLGNAGSSFGSFVSVETIALPILAVLIATHIEPAAPKARLVVLGALIEYAVSALFGVVLLLAGLIGDLQPDSVRLGYVFAAFLGRLGGLALLGLVLFLVIRVYLGAYAPAKPPQGVYGQPAYPYGQPGYPYAQQQYGQQTGSFQQPGYAAGAQTVPVPQGYPAQPGYQQQTGGWANPQTTGSNPVASAAAAAGYASQSFPAQQAQPTSTGAPAFTAPTSAVPAPTSAAPASGAPGYAAPASGAPAFGAPGTGAQATGAPAYTAPASGAPSFGAPASGAPSFGTGEPVSGTPSTESPLSSPFASYNAPATAAADEPVSASPADSGPSTPPSGFAAAGWPGGTSTHPGPQESAPVPQAEGEAASPFGKTGAFPPAGSDATTAFAPASPDEAPPAVVADAEAPADTEATGSIPPADPDATATVIHQAADPEVTGTVTQATTGPRTGDPEATAAFPHVQPAQADRPADPDATTVLGTSGEEPTAANIANPTSGDDDTQRTQVIPPRS
ncbi:hypothetical protein Dfulv_43305 [Dactylosporangium fulvum]|uniref:Uncharacterized protein n=1 Tax=Dactylosporangium fulvum TaxID=53359 RepID=A0ABY5VXE0_9ACTN|nr:hypothetical protein [Dactylosporangium fulvum]UWP81849.1 hypothetical protein Dfulv_43305 [Dactylosporangium fulvum]